VEHFIIFDFFTEFLFILSEEQSLSAFVKKQ